MSSVIHPPRRVNSAALAVELVSTVALAAEVVGLAAILLARRPRVVARNLTDEEATGLARRKPGAMAIEGRCGWLVVANAYRMEGGAI